MSKLKSIFTSKVRMAMGFVLLISMIGFTQVSQSDSTCKGLTVLVENTVDNHFLDVDDVTRIATMNGDVLIEGQSMEDIDLKSMEIRLRENPYVKSTEIYKDLESNLIVQVSLRRPTVRILRENGPGAYVTADGSIMPLSESFVTRTLLVSGSTDSLLSDTFYTSTSGKQLLDLFNFIHEDEFWRAQIAEVEVQNNGELLLYPQVTKQVVEFGIPTQLDWKFRKLKVFYKEILPRQGWNRYERVKLEFGDQIIAQ